MEHKKKKNDADRSDRNIFIGIGIVCVIGLFVLMFMNRPFSQTATPLLATNPAVATLLMQTEIAATQQFIMTSTALP